MRKIFFIIILFTVISVCKAQTIDSTNSEGVHRHKGFYLSLSLGANRSKVTMLNNNGAHADFTGYGIVLDAKIGWAVKENLVLHATITSKSTSGPEVTSGGTLLHVNTNNFALGEVLLGGGVTYYFMPENIFLSGSAGIGRFVSLDSETESSGASDKGLSIQAKAGKEWWVAKNLALGFAITFEKTFVEDDVPFDLFVSNNLGIHLNMTFN